MELSTQQAKLWLEKMIAPACVKLEYYNKQNLYYQTIHQQEIINDLKLAKMNYKVQLSAASKEIVEYKNNKNNQAYPANKQYDEELNLRTNFIEVQDKIKLYFITFENNQQIINNTFDKFYLLLGNAVTLARKLIKEKNYDEIELYLKQAKEFELGHAVFFEAEAADFILNKNKQSLTQEFHERNQKILELYNNHLIKEQYGSTQILIDNVNPIVGSVELAYQEELTTPISISLAMPDKVGEFKSAYGTLHDNTNTDIIDSTEPSINYVGDITND